MAGNGPEEGTSDSRRDPLIGALVNGKYRVQSAIARGGMGRIYYATQEPLERPVALKVVQADGDHEHESQFLKRFLQEASILAKLQHPNVVTLFDYGPIEGSHVEQYFIAMEFLAGETLTHRLKNRQRLLVGETLILGRQIVRGLREAHKRGVVHRDLKPSNIIIVPEGDGSEIVKLVDFGIGKVLGRPGDSQDLTQDGVFVGTPRYMAPEQFEGSAFPASDFYALGTILFQALAGRLPFVGSTMAELMVAKLAREVPTIRSVAPDVDIPDSLEALVLHLLARKPEDRPSMEELHAHMMACEEEVFGTPHSMRRGNSSGPHAFSQSGSGPHRMGQSGSGPMMMTGSGPMMARSGSHMHSGSTSVPSIGHGAFSGDQLRVPHTVVAPIPSYAQMTPRPMELPPASHHGQNGPPSGAGAERKPSRAPLFAALGLFVILLAGGGIFWKVARTPGPAGMGAGGMGAGAATDRAGAGSAGAAGENGSSAAFTLTIESAPPGAIVSEGTNVLGETPLKVAVDRASVSPGPRTFVVMKEGFAPSHVVQGPSKDDVRSVVSLAVLAQDAAAPVKSRPNGGKPVAQTGAPPPKPSTVTPPAGGTTSGSGTDIRLKR